MLIKLATEAAASASPDIPVSVQDSFTLSIFGILMVFAVLAVLAVLIYLLGKFFRSSNKKEGVDSAVLADTPAPAEKVRDPLKLVNTDDKTAALIMAIVAEKSGLPLENLDFKSITLMEE